MSTKIKNQLEGLLNKIKEKDAEQKEFYQTVKEIVESCEPLFEKYPHYLRILPVLCEPDRVIQFKVTWCDDQGNLQVNRGFRVQFSQAIGPYKGGLRFHPTVNLSVMKFLGLEQILKNALTQLPLGGAKGGSDFDPKGKSEAEVLRFCQSFMDELYRYIGPDTDVPAGDIGVGTREIGYMYGQWKKLTTNVTGVLTGKGCGWGGSNIRTEATGYGLVYITQIALNALKEDIKGKRVCISGSGNVAQYAGEKCLQEGAIVLTFSDSDGTIYEPDGFSKEGFYKLMEIKQMKRGRCSDFTKESKTAKYYAGKKPWNIKCDIALPCATQNEVDANDAKALVANGCSFVTEGANMPSTPEAIKIFKNNCRFFLPSKAANAGGVAISGLEMAQNSQRQVWSREEVNKELHNIMENIFITIRDTARDLNCEGDFQMGANAAGFRKVADAMFAQGFVLPINE